MSKNITALLSEVRESTENETFTDEIGFTDEELIKFFQDAISRLHNKIIAQHPMVFTEIVEESLTNGQESVNIPFDAHLGNRIVKVEYSGSGNTEDYKVLSPAHFYSRRSNIKGTPFRYVRYNGKILLQPQPSSSSGKLRITYIRRPLSINKRRYQVSGSPALTASNVWTIAAVNASAIDSAELKKYDYFSVVDKYGALKACNVKYDQSVLTSTTLTLASDYTAAASDSVASGDYIVPSKYASNVLEFDDSVERYLRAYTELKILKRESSVDSQDALAELQAIETDIIKSYADIDGDEDYEIPLINDDCSYNWE